MVKTRKYTKKRKENAITRNPTYHKLYVTNVQGGLTSHDFRFELMNEQIKDNNGNWLYISDGLLILSPIGAKRLLHILEKSVKNYEKEQGVIPLNPDKERLIRIK